MANKIKIPKKAKLITDGGFYKIVDLPKWVLRINIPLVKRMVIVSPETSDFNFNLNFEVEFQFEKHDKKYAYYKQINVILLKK